MTRTRSTSVALAFLSISVFLGDAEAAKKGKVTKLRLSGIYGKLVQIGFPPEHEYMGQEIPLSNMPVGVFSLKDEQEIKRGTTDKDGLFRITLPPGTYYVKPIPPDPDPYGMRYVNRSKKIVKVSRGHFTETKGIYDAGW